MRGGRKTYDLEGVGDNADSHELLSVVAAVHHEGVGKTLNDGALGLAETLLGVAAGRVRQVDGSADLDVVAVWSHRQRVRSMLPRRIRHIAYPDPPRSPFHPFQSVLSCRQGRTHVKEISLISTSS